MYICLVAGISCFFFFLPSRSSSSQTMAPLARLFRLLFIYFVLFSLCYSLQRGNNLKSTTFFARAYGLFFALALYVDKYMCILSIALFEWNQFLSTHIFDRLKCFKCVASVFSSSAELNLLDLLIFFTGSFFHSFVLLAFCAVIVRDCCSNWSTHKISVFIYLAVMCSVYLSTSPFNLRTPWIIC